MNRSEIVRRLLDRTDLAVSEAEWFVERVFDLLRDGLAHDGRVEIRGFGVFRTTKREQAGFTNPSNGVYYPSLPIRTVQFQPSSTWSLGPPSDSD